MITILGNNNSLLSQYLSEIRDKDIQQDRFRFRKNLERIGEIFAYEISKSLKYETKAVQTPLGTANQAVLSDNIVLGTILRAGLPMHTGMLNYFDKADNAFISAYRKYNPDGGFDIKIEYMSSPSLTDSCLIISDPMLASGLSMILAYKELIKRGKPRHTHIVSLIASQEGIKQVQKQLPQENLSIWLGAVDDELTVKSYIVPGLGDAGDLAFGNKE